jgi:hypothetical protein
MMCSRKIRFALRRRRRRQHTNPYPLFGLHLLSGQSRIVTPQLAPQLKHRGHFWKARPCEHDLERDKWPILILHDTTGFLV